MVADQLKAFMADVKKLTAKKVKKEEAIFTVVKKYIKESKRIRFEGNNYSEEWVEEAKKRGLSNEKSSPRALKSFISAETISMFERNNVLSEVEMKARYNIDLENYTKKIQIESRVMGDLSKNHIIPIAIKYQNTLIDNALGLQKVLDDKSYASIAKDQIQTIKDISDHVAEIKSNVAMMLEERRKANRMDTEEEMANAYHDNVIPYFEVIRRHVDKLELLVDDELWPLPKYRELLFMK